MKKLQSIPKYTYQIVLAVCAASLVPIIITSFFGFSSADDYSYSLITSSAINENSFNIFALLSACAEQIKYSWLNWQGTYTSVFMMSLQPGIFSDYLYFITVFIMLSLIIFSFLYFAKAALSFLNASKTEALFIGAIIAFSFIQTMPNPAQGLFWYNGAAHYMPFLAASLFMAGINLYALKKGFSAVKVTLCSLLSFLISGGNLITAFLNLLVLISFCIYYILNIKKGRKKNLICVCIILFFGFIGFLINVAAPGNAVRQSAIDALPGFFETIKVTSVYFFYFVRDWMNLSYWLTLLIITPLLLKLTSKPRGYNLKGLCILIFWLYTVICGMLCVPYFSMGNYGDPRVTNAIYGAMCIMSYVVYAYSLGLLQEKGILKINFCSIKGWPYLTILIVMLGGILVSGNTELKNSTSLTAVLEFQKGIPQTIRAVSLQRLEILNDTRIKDAVLPAYKVKSNLLMAPELKKGPYGWVNAGVAKFYGKNSVVGEQPDKTEK